uniref:C3H1-type domain-containing protein n=1 Tax=Kwoniella bestiolae CBS 10118 TaxID=1296100 RepID=A0A1B9GDK4_9TREE|nr:hypothetical protein I302_00603 [Kwoniella bestiolae CBS 10118]OCF29109.1 hypothetical protein I302_00603 [Kwoniella bestiolae CBS 10118]
MSSHSTTSTPSSPPHTPPPSSPNFKLTLPTPPSFSAHRSSSHSRNTSSTNLADLPNTTQDDPKHSKRMSISSIHDPIVETDKKDRRVSFFIETHKPISRPSPSAGGELKSPIYKIPQRQAQVVSEDREEILNRPDLPVTPPSTTKRRPISFQGVSPSASSRFSNMAALKGISIDQSLSSPKGAFSRSIWSAGILPSSSYSSAKSGWISPISGSSTAAAASKSISSTLKSPLPIAVYAGEPFKSPTEKKGTASEIAKARGLSIAIIKENGKGVLPITPGLTSSTTPGGGLKSPTLASGLKSPEIKILQHIENGLNSAKSTGIPDTAGSIGKKEIILCKFYHTPGLTCTSRPCRFVHNLSSIQGQLGSASAYPNTAAAALSGFRMLSPNQPDPTSGTFAHAQMTLSTASDYPKKTLKVNEDGGMDLGDVMPGEKVLIEDENGEEVVGQVFFMSGGGKGAMGKSREKWKTVPCKDYAEGHCPYGDYCSFIQYKSEEERPETEAKPVQHRLTHRKSASLSSCLTAWTKALPKAILVPSVKVDPQVLAKTEGHLSAFAPPFLREPVAVDETGDLIPAAIESVKATATTPPARAKEPIAIPMEPTITAPPKLTAWAKGPPPNLRKVASIKTLSLPPRDQGNGNGLTPTSASHLMPPVSAISMFGTESDPASPFDPVVQRRKLQELEDSLRSLPRSNLSERSDYPHEQPPTPNEYYNHTQSNIGGNRKTSVLNSTTYPWGMPMSPLPGHGDPTIPSIPGGLGVIWTPTGWAVQDAAMKNALRSAEVKARYGEDSKRRTAKNYFRTKPCRFFAEGFCPHGDECTYMHITVPSSPEQSSSGSESGGSIGISQTFSPTLSQGQVQLYGPLSGQHAVSLPQQPHPKHQTLPCKFYNSSLGCNNGDRCNFLHTRVVPESVMMVERPRPWRTKPCRHFQLNRCTLGDACHFAHVLDPAWVNSGFGSSHGVPQWNVGGGDGGNRLTEESLEKTLQEMRMTSSQGRGEDDEDEEEDDVEIVTAVGDMTFSSASYSPPSSVRA